MNDLRFVRPEFKLLLSLIFLVCFDSLAMAARVDTRPIIIKEPIVVTGSRLTGNPVEELDFPGRVEVITREELKRSRGLTLADLLSRLPGISVYDSGGNEFDKVVSVRGFSKGQDVLYLVDGVPINQRSDNRVNFQALPPKEAIDSVEIIYGPASSLFGGRAISSVVNIITVDQVEKNSLELTGGSYSLYELGFNAGTEFKFGDLFISGRMHEREGYRENAASSLDNLLMSGVMPVKETGRVDFMVGLNLSEVEAPNALTDTELTEDRRQSFTEGDYRTVDRVQTSISYSDQLSENFRFHSNVYGQKQETFFRTTSRVWGSTSRIDDTEETLGGRALVELDYVQLIFPGKLLFGISKDHTSRDYRGDWGADRTDRQKNNAFFIENRVYLSNKFSVSGGFRYSEIEIESVDHVNDTNLEFNYYPSSFKVGTELEIYPKLILYAQYGEAFRPPDFDHIAAMAGPWTTFNPDLKPEDSRTREAGLKFRTAAYQFIMAAFQIQTYNEIVFKDNTNKNLDKTSREGMEVSLDLPLTDRLNLQGGYTYLRAIIEEYAADESYEGNRVPMVPRHQGDISLEYYPNHNVNLSLAGRYVGEQYVISDQANTGQQLSDYFTLDFTGIWDYSEQFSFKFGVNNLTDKKYSSRAVLASNEKTYYSTAPERNYSFSTTWNF